MTLALMLNWTRFSMQIGSVPCLIMPVSLVLNKDQESCSRNIAHSQSQSALVCTDMLCGIDVAFKNLSGSLTVDPA